MTIALGTTFTIDLKNKYAQKIAEGRKLDRRIKMKRCPYLPSMVQAITVLTVLKMMTKDTVLAQTSCGSGSMNGKVLYERLPNVQLQGFDDDVIRDTGPPFSVLEKCQDLCLRDRSSNNIVRQCSSFDFQPGSRIATFNGGAEYEESLCYLSNEQARPEGLGQLMVSPNSIHFTEICLTSTRPGRECPNRRYVFERHPRKKLKLPQQDLKEMQAENRTQCEDICLNEFSFVCRSATFDYGMKTCILSRFTRRTHPELLQDDPDSDYLENTCLDSERRCDGLAVFIKEENKRLGGPFEVDMFSNFTLEECQGMCVRAEKYLCRSIEFDEMTKQCTLSEEDSVSQKDDIGVASSPTHHFYDFVCLDSPRGSEYPDNSVTSHLFSDKNKKPDTAFQRYRNSRLAGEHHSEISGRSLSECLDECLRQPSFQCRSAEYSERYRTCRLTRYNQRDGMRIIYDADYDYYENLMLGGDDSGTSGSRPGEGGTYRPSDVVGGDRHRPSSSGGRFPPFGGRYPTTTGSRYPPSSGGYDDYDRPPYDRFPDDRYPNGVLPERPFYPSSGGNRYPVGPDRYPTDRYPQDRYNPRYPPSSGGGKYPLDRYPPSSTGGKYPLDRYPPSLSGGKYPLDRYPPSSTGGKYPLDRYPPSSSGGKYPFDSRYPSSSSGGRYPSGGGRYPYDDRYPLKPERPIYAGRPSYDARYGNRYGDRYDYRNDPYLGDRAGSRYGGPDDRLGGRYDGAGSRIFNGGGGRLGSSGGSHYDSNRYDYYGDDRDGGSRWFFRPDRRPLGRPIDLGYSRPNDNIGYNRPIDIGSRPIDIGSRPIEIRPSISRPGLYDRPGGYDRPVGHRRPISPGPDGPIYDRPPLDDFSGNGIGVGGHRPYTSRCDEGDNFKQMGTRQRARKEYIRKSLYAPTLLRCQQECIGAEDFICRAFNFRDVPSASNYEMDRDNCELSERDSRDMEMGNPVYFDSTGGYDFYERSMARSGLDGECLDVSQVCNEDGMEFTLRTAEPFYGRIYTHGYYERCFFRGNGGTVNVLRISGAQGYPECGTQRYGDTMTNIAVVQFTENVQTGRDKRFNLTCLFRGPGEAVVSSGFIGAGSGSPIPIEYLPAENTLSSKVRLMILYQGRPTTTIAVGDPLTFRIESQDGHNYLTDIFATNVVARDPYSGRSVQLIDRFGCPVDPFVFPELDKGRSGDTLEARFNAFKIPESNFLVFEATVRTCREGCQPAYCQTGSGRSEPSFGRRKRSIDNTALLENLNSTNINSVIENPSNTNSTDIEISSLGSTVKFFKVSTAPSVASDNKAVKVTSEDGVKKKENEETEYVREMIEVFDSREEIAEAQHAEPAPDTICLSQGEYHGLISAVFVLVAILLTASLLVGLAYRKYWLVMRKNLLIDRVSSSNFSTAPSYPTASTRSTSGFSGGLSIFGTTTQKPFGILNPSFPNIPKSSENFDCPGLALSGLFEDPSEPIYTDPSLFERSRSLRSIAVSSKRRKSPPKEIKI